MAALQKFLEAELHRRDLSVEEFARRVPFSTSRGYQIVRDGQDNVRLNTFVRIAAALDISVADLVARMGTGLSEWNAADLKWIDLGRRVPLELEESVVAMMRAAANGSGQGTAKLSGRRLSDHQGANTPPLQSRKRAFALAIQAAILWCISPGTSSAARPAAVSA
jgi:DNA-binding Xre family transcriptional regulator